MNFLSHRFSKSATQKFEIFSALKVYLKLNKKVVLTTLSTHNKHHLMKKISSNRPIPIENLNFKTFRAEMRQMFELLIWKIDEFINLF